MAKKLRLAVAAKTDIGRRRERNQDNVTHFVPTDEATLAEKGALFVVCDGMGGHAAGEVAAEMGVNAIRDVYYASQDPNIISRFAEAVKKANLAIFNYAREHSEMNGMGTTCVALVIHGGRGYFINIGDSRAYLVRDGVMRQVTLDHSWVAEQVRAGLLTEEQARFHSHRNVITRSLGTQPTVSADLFIETLNDGDRVLLCSDGLHGYVDEADIARELGAEAEPEVGVRNLIDMANANGGPDNITALMTHVVEAPEVTDEVVFPDLNAGEEEVITQPMPAVTRASANADTTSSTGGAAVAVAERQSSGASASLTRKDGSKRRGDSRNARNIAVAAAGEAVTLAAPTTARRRGVAAGLRLLMLVTVLLGASALWYATLGPYGQTRAATQRAQSDITSAQQTAAQANGQDPATALAALNKIHQRLLADLSVAQLPADLRQQAQDTLDTQVTPAVRGALQRYDTAAKIQPIAATDTYSYTVGCVAPDGSSQATLDAVSSFTSVANPTPPPGGPAPATQTLYAIAAGALYQISAPLDATGKVSSASVSCAALGLPAGASASALTSYGSMPYVLLHSSDGNYSVASFTVGAPDKNGVPQATLNPRVTLPTTHGEQPTLLAADAQTLYVAFTGGAGGAAGVWTFPPNAKTPTQTTTLQQAAASLAVVNATLYLLLADGSLGQLDTKSTYLPLMVTIAPSLSPLAPTDYTSSSPTPTTATTTGATGLPGAILTTDPSAQATLLVGDDANQRVVRLAAGANVSDPGLSVVGQYVYSGSALRQFALATDGKTVSVYVWSQSHLLAFSVAEPAN